MSTNDIVELRRDASALKSRVDSIEAEVTRLRDADAETGRVLAEHSVTLTYIRNDITDIKSSVTAFSESVSKLSEGTAVLRSKLTWLIFLMMLAAQSLGGPVGEMLKKGLELLQ